MGSNPQKSLLDVLRSQTAVDCDTFDVEVPKKLSPFVDCTSNQAIAYGELTRLGEDGNPVHAQLIQDAVNFASSKSSAYPGVSVAELAVETMMVKLALRIVPYLKGYSHIQTNPKYSYDKQKTIENGKRIVAIFKALDPEYDSRRVCIKIPSTWEGMQACRELESQGIATLATTMFCLEQASLAAHVGCTYIAPYINELRVHFDEGYVDQHKAFDFCGAAQRYYEKIGSKTQVLPASLTSIQEVMKLSGVHHITVAPHLLTQLAETPADPWDGEIGSVLKGGKEEVLGDYGSIVENESAWRLAFTRSQDGKSEGKIIQAINIFCDKQEGLEGLVK
ncbi:putative transaldolase [Annulohypoxylon truncatum]|uniref:putative transaldolase n=1 Tax=Annulohypoxylon truncatum TaxID=327061 RepID=UPI0020075E6A|nr:putative transaldolase [Annulohypoxylon truncatum]KAI1206975.1 putative transaldolase [Annulohypoxylon truncatum]